MPTFTLRNIKTEEEWDVKCTTEELMPLLEDDNIIRVLKMPNIVSGVGNLHSKVPDGFRDKLKDMKSKSGKGNTIKI